MHALYDTTPGVSAYNFPQPRLRQGGRTGLDGFACRCDTASRIRPADWPHLSETLCDRRQLGALPLHQPSPRRSSIVYDARDFATRATCRGPLTSVRDCAGCPKCDRAPAKKDSHSTVERSHRREASMRLQPMPRCRPKHPGALDRLPFLGKIATQDSERRPRRRR